MKCPRCHTENLPNGVFYSSCGFAFVSVKRKNSISAPIAIVIGIASLCGLRGIIGGIGAIVDEIKKPKIVQNNSDVGGEPPVAATPTPSPTPVSIAVWKSKTDEFVKFEKDEYQTSDLTQFDDVVKVLREIPKESKDFKQAQLLIKKLNEKSSRIGAEILVLGPKPSEGELYVAFNSYLRTRLNDYSSSEYVNYTLARKVVIKGEPFWVSVLSLRAKNAFGGYILKDVTMFIRNKEVVLADGL